MSKMNAIDKSYGAPEAARGQDVKIQTWMQAPGVRSMLILRHEPCDKAGEFLFVRTFRANQIWACDGCGAQIELHAKA